VLELRAPHGAGASDLGVAAARLVSAALAQTGKYSVIDSATVEAALTERELKPPFGVGHIQLLANALGAEFIVHGSVRGLTLDTDVGSASAVLSLELVDGASGALKSRTEASGAHTAGLAVEADHSALVLATLARAAEKTVEAMTGVEINEVPQEAVGARGSLLVGTLGAAITPEAPGTEIRPRTALPGTDLTASSGPAPQPADGPAVATAATPAPAPGAGAAAGAGKEAPEIAAAPPPAPTDEGLAFQDRPLAEPEPQVEIKVLAKTDPKRVLITLGRDQIVTPKMELEIYRVTVSRDGETTRRRIGRIRVVKINATDAEARILDGAPLIRTGDYGYCERP
jgi:hypothetical protein